MDPADSGAWIPSVAAASTAATAAASKPLICCRDELPQQPHCQQAGRPQEASREEQEPPESVLRQEDKLAEEQLRFTQQDPQQEQPCQSRQHHYFQECRQSQQQCQPQQQQCQHQQHWQQQRQDPKQQQEPRCQPCQQQREEIETVGDQWLGRERQLPHNSTSSFVSSESVSPVGAVALPSMRRDSFHTTALHAAPGLSHNILSPSFRFTYQLAPSSPSPSAASPCDNVAAAPATSQDSSAVTAAARMCYSPLRYPFAFRAPRAVALSESFSPAAAPAAASPLCRQSAAAAAASDAGPAVPASDTDGGGASLADGGTATAAAAASPPASLACDSLRVTTLSTDSLAKTLAGNKGECSAVCEADKEQHQCVSVLVGAAACWLYGVSLLTLQTPLTAAAFCTAQQQRAFRMQLLLLPLLRVAIALYLLLAFFEEPANPATTASAATRHKLPPFPVPQGVQTSSAPPRARAFTAADPLSAAGEVSQDETSQGGPAAPTTVPPRAAATGRALLQTRCMHVGPAGSVAATPRLAQGLQWRVLPAATAESRWPPQHVSLSTIFYRPHIRMSGPRAVPDTLSHTRGYSRLHQVVKVRPSSAAAAALLLHGEAAFLESGWSGSTHLSGRRLSATGMPAELSSKELEQPAAVTALTAADSPLEEGSILQRLQQQQQQRSGPSRACSSLHRSVRRRRRCCCVASPVNVLESGAGVLLPDASAGVQQDGQQLIREQEQRLLQPPSGSTNIRTHVVQTDVKRASPTAAGTPTASPTTFAGSVGRLLTPAATEEAGFGPSAAATNPLYGTAVPAIRDFSSHTADPGGQLLLGSAAAGDALLPFAGDAGAALPSAGGGRIAAADTAAVLPSSPADLGELLPGTVLAAPRRPAGQQQQQSLNGGRGLSASAQQQQQTLLPALSPWWERLLHLAAALGCLLLFLATALLECTYRGCCLPSFVSRLWNCYRRSAAGNYGSSWMRSDSRRRSSDNINTSDSRIGVDTSGRSSSSKSDGIGIFIQSSNSGRGEPSSESASSSASAAIAEGEPRLRVEKPWPRQATNATQKPVPISAAAGDLYVTGIAVLPVQLMLLLVGSAVSLADVLIAGTLLLQLPPAACAVPPVGRSATSCLSAAVAAAAEKTQSRAVTAFLSLYKPLFFFRLARPLLLALLCHPVLMMLVRIVRTLPKVKTIVLAAFLSVLLFDWLGVILFAGTGSHDEFHSFGRGCVSLLLVITTVRLPQVLLQGYAVHEVAVLFIVLFYLLTAVLLGLFAAAFYTAYRDADTEDRRRQVLLALRYVRSAFDLLVRAEQQQHLQQQRSEPQKLAQQEQQPQQQQQQHGGEPQLPQLSQEQRDKELRQEERGISGISRRVWLQFYIAYISLPEALQRFPSSTLFGGERMAQEALMMCEEQQQQQAKEDDLDAAAAEPLLLGSSPVFSQQQHTKEDGTSGGQKPQQQWEYHRTAQQQPPEHAQQHGQGQQQGSQAQQQRHQGRTSSIRLVARAAGTLGFLGAPAQDQIILVQSANPAAEEAERGGAAVPAGAAAAVVPRRPSTAAVEVAAAARVLAAQAANVEYFGSSQAGDENSAAATFPTGAGGTQTPLSRGVPGEQQAYGGDSATAAAADSSSWGLAEAGLYDVEHYVGRGTDNSSSVAVVGTASECEEQSAFTDESSSSSIVLSSGRRRRPPLLQEILLQPSYGTRRQQRRPQGSPQHTPLHEQQMRHGQRLRQEQHEREGLQQEQKGRLQEEEGQEQEQQQREHQQRQSGGDLSPLGSRPFAPEVQPRSQSMRHPSDDGTDNFAGAKRQPCKDTNSSSSSRSKRGTDDLRSAETVEWCDDAASRSALKLVAPTTRSSSSAALFTRSIRLATEGEELFQLLDRKQKRRLCWDDFAWLVPTLAEYKGEKKREEEERWNSKSSGDPVAVRRRRLNTAADVCVAVSLLLTYMQTRKFIKTASNLTGDDIEASPVDLAEGMPASCFGSVAGIYWLQNALSFVYLLAVVVRVSAAASLKRYTGLSLRERFDMLMGVAVMTLEAACLWAGSASAFHPACTTETFDDLSRSLAFVRVLRGVRLCFRVSALRKMITSLVAAVAALNTVLLLLIVVFCTYATLGMELFGGIIKCDMEHLPPKGPDMEDPTDWGVLNFNHFFASLVTLFLLTVNGWDDSLKALVKQTSVISCGAYFVSFYLLTDTIILNLLVALVLEAYDQIISTTSHKRLKAKSCERLSDARPAVLARLCRRCTLWWRASHTLEQRDCAA